MERYEERVDTVGYVFKKILMYIGLALLMIVSGLLYFIAAIVLFVKCKLGHISNYETKLKLWKLADGYSSEICEFIGRVVA